MKAEVIFIILLVALVLGTFGLLFVACKHEAVCMDACGNDPVYSCYSDRATCVGMGQNYTVPLK
jgi:hypothetical protein